MKIVVTSDTHEQEPELPGGDLLIHAGDWSGCGNKNDTLKFIEWMKRIKPQFKHGIVVVPGNHELYVANREIEIRNKFRDIGVNFLVNKHTVIEGVCIYGTPHSLPFFNWAYMASEQQCQNTYKRIRLDTQIIVSHGPAKGLLDWVPRGENVGSQALLDAIDRVKPKYCFVGHIHEMYGHVTHGPTEYYNVAHGYSSDRRHPPAVVEI